MVRFLLLILAILASPLTAADLGRTDRLWRDFLSETVSRALPVLAEESTGASVPYWPEIDQDLRDARSLEAGPDVDLLESWTELHQGFASDAEKRLRSGWPRPGCVRFSPRAWGEALFESWNPEPDPTAWTQAWLAWDEKLYSPRTLVRGLSVLEKSDPSAVVPLLAQAIQLYPEDRRILPLVVRHPEVSASSEALIARDRALWGGWAPGTLRSLMTRNPEVRGLLLKAGYPDVRLDSALQNDYGTWLASRSTQAPGDGQWTWDSQERGGADSALIFQAGHLVTWTRTRVPRSLWALEFDQGKPSVVSETRDGATWTLTYEAYPWAHTLEYTWGKTRILYRFRPLAQSIPLWPEERFHANVEKLPEVLADLWLPLDPRAMAAAAASVETWVSGVRASVCYLYQGEVWLKIEDSTLGGRDDTWSYYRSGRLVSVYHDSQGLGQGSIRELYSKGELTQVQTQSSPGPRAEFVLFPQDGVQLWDPHGSGRPLDRLFVWEGSDRLSAFVFSGSSLPWETMPPWEPRP